MSMFCYQCQETAMGTGCTLKGVCGKTSEVANLQDLLLFVVRGIAVYNEHLRKDGHPSEQADKFIYDALFITITNANFDKAAITEKIKEGKAHDRAVSLPHAQRNQKQIDVAQVQRQLIKNAEAIGIVRMDIRCVHGQRELVAGKQREIKKANADQIPGAPCFRFSAQQQEYEQHRRYRKQKQKQMRPAKGRNRKFVHFTRRNVFPVFSSRNRLNSSTVPPVRVRLSRDCA